MKKKHIDHRIEKKRFLFFQAGLLIAISIVIVAFNIKGEATARIPEPKEPEDLVHELDKVFVVLEEEIKEPEPEKKEQPKKADPFKIDPLNKEINDSIDPADKFKLDTSLFTIKKPEAKVFDDNDIIEGFIAAGQEPLFPGGKNAMLNWLKKNTVYPATELEQGIGGRVSVSFVVEKDGSITNVKVVKGVSPGLDREAVRAVGNMPKWEPALQYGKKVRVRVTIPVMFKVIR